MALGALAGCSSVTEKEASPTEPTIIFSAQLDQSGERPTSIAVDRDHVYWVTETGDLHRVQDDGNNHVIVASDTRPTRQLVSTDHGLYWALGEALLSVDESGTVTELTTGSIVQAAGRAAEVFWIESGAAGADSVRGIPRAGGSAATWYTGAATSLAAGEAAIFVAVPGGSAVQMARIDSAGGATTTLGTETEYSHRPLVATDHHLYWSTTAGAVKRVTSGGGSVEQVATELGGGFYADADGVYGFSASSEYTLVHVKLDGERSEIVSTDRQALAVATNDRGAYWVDWKSECLAYDQQGKDQACVKYAHELRVWALAK